MSIVSPEAFLSIVVITITTGTAGRVRRLPEKELEEDKGQRGDRVEKEGGTRTEGRIRKSLVREEATDNEKRLQRPGGRERGLALGVWESRAVWPREKR